MCLESDQGFYLWNAAWTELVLPLQQIHIFFSDIHVSAICNSLSNIFEHSVKLWWVMDKMKIKRFSIYLFYLCYISFLWRG